MQLDAQKDLSYYMVRWLAFGAVTGIFSPIVSHNAMTSAFVWGEKAQHLVWGILFGAACGYAFTWLQNRFNMGRDRKRTLGIIAVMWTGFNIAFAGMAFV